MADIRRGWVQIILQSAPFPFCISFSRINCGSWVVFPHPVSPETTRTFQKQNLIFIKRFTSHQHDTASKILFITWFLEIACKNSSLILYAGSFSLNVSIDLKESFSCMQRNVRQLKKIYKTMKTGDMQRNPDNIDITRIWKTGDEDERNAKKSKFISKFFNLWNLHQMHTSLHSDHCSDSKFEWPSKNKGCFAMPHYAIYTCCLKYGLKSVSSSHKY